MSVLRQLNTIELSRALDRLSNPIPGGKIEAARDFGVDLSLLIEQLKLSPVERSMRMHALAQGMESSRGSARKRKA